MQRPGMQGVMCKWWPLVAVCAGTFMLLIDVTIVNVALPDMATALGLGLARPWVTGSGVAELATAGLLVVPRTRSLGGWAAAGLLASFVPAHLQTVRALSGRRRAVALARLPFQVPMVAAALRGGRSR